MHSWCCFWWPTRLNSASPHFFTFHYAHLGSQRKNLLGVASRNPNDKSHRVPGDPDRNMSHTCGGKTRPPTDRVTSPYGAHMGLAYQFSISYHISTHSTSCQIHPNQLISTANPLATPALHSRSRLCKKFALRNSTHTRFYNEEQTLRLGHHSPSKSLIRNFRNKINVPKFLRPKETKTK